MTECKPPREIKIIVEVDGEVVRTYLLPQFLGLRLTEDYVTKDESLYYSPSGSGYHREHELKYTWKEWIEKEAY